MLCERGSLERIVKQLLNLTRNTAGHTSIVYDLIDPRFRAFGKAARKISLRSVRSDLGFYALIEGQFEFLQVGSDGGLMRRVRGSLEAGNFAGQIFMRAVELSPPTARGGVLGVNVIGDLRGLLLKCRAYDALRAVILRKLPRLPLIADLRNDIDDTDDGADA